MAEIRILSVEPQEKGKVKLQFENGTTLVLYRGELKKLSQTESRQIMKEGTAVPEALYNKLLYEIVGIRAKKRAIFLLEQMDRTQQQLTEKLKQSDYPQECIEDAVAYVKRCQYLDDFRYAKTYVRYRQGKKSRQKLKMDLMAKGVKRELIEQAIEEEYDTDETVQIRQLLEKRHYSYDRSNQKEMQRTYQYLMRRGFRSSDILRIMKTDTNSSFANGRDTLP